MATDQNVIRDAVRERYAEIARISEDTPSSCCGSSSGCCESPKLSAIEIGYRSDDVNAAPDAAAFSLGCGNPTAIAELRKGETVLDLGAGGGFDCFLAARQVGPEGRVIGVDMTPEMVSKARRSAEKLGYTNIEFRLGEIEHLPVADSTVDVIISNCVVNLAPDKRAVYADAFRALARGGRIAISDVVETTPLPDELRDRTDLLSACTVGAIGIDAIMAILRKVGYVDSKIDVDESSRGMIDGWAPGLALGRYLASALITARKPA